MARAEASFFDWAPTSEGEARLQPGSIRATAISPAIFNMGFQRPWSAYVPMGTSLAGTSLIQERIDIARVLRDGDTNENSFCDHGARLHGSCAGRHHCGRGPPASRLASPSPASSGAPRSPLASLIANGSGAPATGLARSPGFCADDHFWSSSDESRGEEICGAVVVSHDAPLNRSPEWRVSLSPRSIRLARTRTTPAIGRARRSFPLTPASGSWARDRRNAAWPPSGNLRRDRSRPRQARSQPCLAAAWRPYLHLSP